MPTLGGDASKTAIRSINVLWYSKPDDAKFSMHLNRYGFRGRTWKARANPGLTRVAFFGDSFTEGLMARDEETIACGFAKRAKISGDGVECLNFGVGGLEPEQYLLLLIDGVAHFNLDKVVVVVFANDLSGETEVIFRGPVSFEPYNYWKPRIWELVDMLRRGECLPCRWNFINRPFFYPIDHPNCPEIIVKRVERSRGIVDQFIYEAMTEGKFAPMRVGGSSYLEKPLQQSFDLTETLKELKGYCEVYGSELYLVYLPDRGMVTNYYKKFEKTYSRSKALSVDLTQESYHLHRRLLEAQCKKVGVPFKDFTPFVVEMEARDEHLYWDYDDHMRGWAYLKIGEEIHDWMSGMESAALH